MVERTVITLYLATWQKRMLIDYVRDLKEANKVKFNIKDVQQLVMYKQPPELIGKGSWNLYLTDEQITKVKDVLGLKTKIAALNVTPEMLKTKAITFE